MIGVGRRGPGASAPSCARPACTTGCCGCGSRPRWPGSPASGCASSWPPGSPGPEGSALKLAFARLNQEIAGLEVELPARRACATTTGPCAGPSSVDFTGRDAGYRYLRAKGNSIEGGTSEILRNIVAERVLGLPAEPRVDKDVPGRTCPDERRRPGPARTPRSRRTLRAPRPRPCSPTGGALAEVLARVETGADRTTPRSGRPLAGDLGWPGC